MNDRFNWFDDELPIPGAPMCIVEDCTHGESGPTRLVRGHRAPGTIRGGPAPMYSQARAVRNVRVVSVETDADGIGYFVYVSSPGAEVPA